MLFKVINSASDRVVLSDILIIPDECTIDFQIAI